MQTAPAKIRTHFTNILFATDFSDAAARAVPYVKLIAKRYESNLVAFHVRPPVVNPMTQPGYWPAYIEAGKAVDEKHRKELLDMFPGISTGTLIVEGDIQSSLDIAIRSNHIDLVVIGTHGRTGIEKFVLGSVAEEIFRHVTCPVLTVGPHADFSTPESTEIREILYATDFNPQAQRAAAYAVSLAEEFQAGLTLLNVIPEGTVGSALWPDVRESSKDLLRKLVPPDEVAWCQPEYIIERGDPAERILDLTNFRKVDLIVLGAATERGFPGAATHLPMAIAHKVVARANCPVLTVRTQ
jgi:nucleotide-binding universal stress UspA family protein